VGGHFKKLLSLKIVRNKTIFYMLFIHEKDIGSWVNVLNVVDYLLHYVAQTLSAKNTCGKTYMQHLRNDMLIGSKSKALRP
jgi:hypothetical protein